MATELNLESEDVQVSTLLYALGKEAEQVYGVCNSVEKLNNYFVPKVNVIHERARFYKRAQRQGESAEEYIRTLYESVRYAKIENIRDKLLIGILDKELSEKLQLTADLTLDRAVEIVRQSEQIKGQISQQAKASSADTSYLSEVAHNHGHAATPHQQYRGRGRRQNSGSFQAAGHRDGGGKSKCFRCGKDHPKHAQCAARNAQCRNCHKVGHFAVVCQSK